MPRRAAFPARYICQEASILYLILDCVRGFDALLYRRAIPQEIWMADRLLMISRSVLYSGKFCACGGAKNMGCKGRFHQQIVSYY